MIESYSKILPRLNSVFPLPVGEHYAILFSRHLGHRNKECKFRVSFDYSSGKPLDPFDDATFLDGHLYLLQRYAGDQAYTLLDFKNDPKTNTMIPQKHAVLDRMDRMQAWPTVRGNAKLLISDAEHIYVAVPEIDPAEPVLYKRKDAKFEQVQTKGGH